MTYILVLLSATLIMNFTANESFSDARPPYFFQEIVDDEGIKPIPGRNIYFFIRKNNDIIAEATVGFTIQHEDIRDLEILFNSPKSLTVTLLKNDAQILPATDHIYDFTFDSPDQLSSGSLKSFSASNLYGRWLMEIIDKKQENSGELISWYLEIAPAVLATMNTETNIQKLNLNVDGYGSFGDQSYNRDSNLGAKFSSERIQDSTLQSTVYHSSLFSHNHQQFVSSFDMFPGNRLPTVEIKQLDGEIKESEFKLDDLNVTLQQFFEERVNGAITLVQEYTFRSNTPHKPLLLTRYINPKFQDQDPPQNYAAIQKDGQTIKTLYVFDELEAAINEKTRYIAIENSGEQVSYYNHSNSHWFLDVLNTTVPERLFQRNLDFYPHTGEQEVIADANSDSITDPGLGFDVALLLASKVEFNNNNIAKFTTRTTWGASSPAELLYENQPPTPTPTPINRGLRAVNDLPDLRVFRYVPDQKLIDLDEYVQHGSVAQQDLEWNIVNNRGLPLIIDQDHNLICHDFPFPGSYGNVIISVNDGKETLFLKTEIKVSTMMTNSFFPSEKILLKQNQSFYTSSHSLDDYLYSHPMDYQPHNAILKWEPAPNLPPGVERVEILEDNRFYVEVNDNLNEQPKWLPFKLAWATFTPTPGETTPTNTPTSTQIPTLTPSLTATPTLEDTPTLTNTPTSTNTPTLTNTPTSSFTPTLTHTVQPTSTNTPSPTFTSTLTPTSTLPPTPVGTRTPTPTATPDLGCNDFITLQSTGSIQNTIGPADWLIYEDETQSETLMFSSEFDGGQVGVYTINDDQTFSLSHKFAADYGVSNIAVQDLNQNNQPDLIAYNPLDGLLYYYENIRSKRSQPSLRFALEEDFLPSPFNSITSNVYRSLAVGNNGRDGFDVIIRGDKELLIYNLIDDQFQEYSRISLHADSSFLVGKDLDHDDDMDLIVGTQFKIGTQRIERVFIYENEEGNYTQTDTIRTDLGLSGNFAREAILVPNGEQETITIALLLFSNEIEYYQANGNLNFEKTHELNIFPPGLVESISFAELTGDTNPELLALYRGQIGLSLFAVCGNTIYSNPSYASLSLSNLALEGQLYKLGAYDFNQDGLDSVILSRSFRDQILFIENTKN